MTNAPRFDHIVALTDRFGTFEHASFTTPRIEHGYCVDDVARVLLTASREPDPTHEVMALAEGALAFLIEAQAPSGRIINRRRGDGSWRGVPSVEDCWGRSLWALGTCSSQTTSKSAMALQAFERGASQRSPWRKAMAFASLGAASVLEVAPDNAAALSLIDDAVSTLGAMDPGSRWIWPEKRLSYANAALADGLIAAGAALDRPTLIDHGLTLLAWLLDRESDEGHLSVTPSGGSSELDHGPAFDQQPIEVATMAEACMRAYDVTGESRWALGVTLAAAWFDGENDVGVRMWDPLSHGGFDGLHRRGPNRNQGAESTLALIATRQMARRLASVCP